MCTFPFSDPFIAQIRHNKEEAERKEQEEKLKRDRAAYIHSLVRSSDTVGSSEGSGGADSSNGKEEEEKEGGQWENVSIMCFVSYRFL